MTKDFDKLQMDVSSAAGLGTPESTGFYTVNCHICKNDRKTGGWKFESDKIVYNCFRASCSASTVFEMGKPVPRKFRALCNELGVSIPPALSMVRSGFQKALETLDERLYKKHAYTHINRPEGCVDFLEAPEHLQNKWLSFIQNRKISTKDLIICMGGEYNTLLGITLRSMGKIVGYQFITHKGLYLKHFEGNTNILYAPDGYVPEHVIVVEGTLDAKCFPNTVAVLGSKVTPEQAYFLRGKKVTLLPDKTGNEMIKQFHEYGWNISLPDWDAKDLNEAVQKYGVMVAARMVMESVYTDKLKAEIKYKMWVDSKRKVG